MTGRGRTRSVRVGVAGRRASSAGRQGKPGSESASVPPARSMDAVDGAANGAANDAVHHVAQSATII